MSIFSNILIQAGYYAIFGGLILCFTAIILKGFFWKYLKVRLSFGKYVLVKIRSKLRDHFSVGKVEDDFLVFKLNKQDIRIFLKDNKAFYRTLAVNWIDVEEGTNAISKTDYSSVSGFDSAKFSDLLTRALMRPTIATNKEKIIITCLIIIGIGCLIGIYLGYVNYKTLLLIQSNLGMQSNTIGAGGLL